MEEVFCVIIAGGRDFNDYELLKRKCDFFLKNKENIIIISGTARGADSLGEKYAEERGYYVMRFIPNWEKDGKSAGFKRNAEMLKSADAVICFWDGKSKGTKHMIDITREKEIPLRIVKY